LDLGHQAGAGGLQLAQDRRAGHIARTGIGQLNVEVGQFGQFAWSGTVNCTLVLELATVGLVCHRSTGWSHCG
jgi:hypothetical protein